MNRILKRPMFRIGGSAGTGITSGLDQPQKMANGGRTGYQQGSTPNFMAGSIPGFLTSFGLNLLATPPAGNIFQTSAIAARDPFNRLQAGELRRAELAGERKFKEDLAEKEQQAAMDRLTRKIESDEKIAGAAKDITVNELAATVLGDYQNDLNKATNHAEYFINERPELAKKFGSSQMGGLIEINLNDAKSIQRAANLKKKELGKIFKDLNSGAILKLIINPGSNKLTFVRLDPNQTADDTGEILNQTVDTGQKPDFTYLSPGQKKVIEDIQAGADKEFGIGFYD